MTLLERDLLRRIRRREVDSFPRLYAVYGARVYRFCHRLCGNAADAEDLTQEVFVGAYQGLDGFEGRSSLATWLYRIALYRWRASQARRRVETVVWDDARDGGESPDPARAGLARLSLDAALAALSEAQREALLLVKAEGLTCREAAALLDVPEGTLKFRVAQAVARLRVVLGDTEEDAVGEDLSRQRTPGIPFLFGVGHQKGGAR